MTALAALVAFISTPAGSAILLEIPTLVKDVIGIWHQNGTLTTKMIADYLASQQAFDTLVPLRSPGVVAVPLAVK